MNEDGPTPPYLRLFELRPLGLLCLRASLVMLLASYFCTAIYSPELYWHLMLGQWIQRNVGLPSANFWTLIAEDLPWRDYHWLFQWSLAVVENVFGDRGLVLYKALTFAMVVGLVGRIFAIWASDTFIAYLICTIASAGMLTGAPFTPALWGWMLFAVFCDSLYRARYGATLGYFFFVVSIAGVLSANIHPVLLLCAFLVPLALLIPAPGDARLYRDIVLLFLILGIVAFCSPYAGLQIPPLLEQYRQLFVSELIEGHNPGTIYNFSVCFLILLTSLVGTLWYAAPKTLHPRESLLAGAALYCGLASTFLTPYALIYLGFLFCVMWSRSYDGKRGNVGLALELLRDKLGRLPALGVVFVLLSAAFVNAAKLYSSPAVHAFLPGREVDFALETEAPFPMHHPMDIGGYLAYRFEALRGSEAKAAIAPQIAHLRPQLARQAAAVDSLQPGWENYFYSVLAPSSALVRYDTPIYTYLHQHPEWQLVFQDGRRWPSEKKNGKQPGEYSWALFLRDW